MYYFAESSAASRMFQGPALDDFIGEQKKKKKKNIQPMISVRTEKDIKKATRSLQVES